MKIYCIFTVETNDEGLITITWLKDLHLLKEKAFEKATMIGRTACVVELIQTKSWNLDQIKAEGSKPPISEEPLTSSPPQE